MRDVYSVRASLLGFRSAWNLAIAEFMSDKPLDVKKKKIRFEKSIIRLSLGWKVPVKLYKIDAVPAQGVMKRPPLIKLKRSRDPVLYVHQRPSVKDLVPVPA